MKSAGMLALALSLCLALTGASTAATSPQVTAPAFASADVSALECSVVKVEAQDWGTLVQVEVRNPGALAAEPLVFELTASPTKKGAPLAPERVARVDFPYSRRFGRPAPAKGKERYWLHTRLLAADAKFEASVLEASFFSGAAHPKPAFELSKPGRVDLPGVDNAPHTVTSFKLEQNSGFDLDLVFRAKFSAPRDQDALVGVRIRSGAEREWIISELAGRLVFDLGAPRVQTKVEKLELVDWCYVAPADAAADERDFRVWYDDWARWDDPAPAIAGRFSFQLDASDAKWRVSGKFQSAGAAQLRLELDPLPANLKATTVEPMVRKAYDALVEQLQRPTGEELAKHTKVRRVSESTWQLDGPGWWNSQSTGWSGSQSGKDGEFLPNFTVRDGALRASGQGKELDGHVWTTRRVRQGWIVTRRANRLEQYVESFDFGELDGLVVPRAYSEAYSAPAGRRIALELFEVVRSDAPAKHDPPAPPSGPGVETLRAAWEFGYRYPRGKRTFEADFKARVATTDRIWQGVGEFEGHVKLAGYQGFLCQADGWDSYEVEVKAKLPEITSSLVAAAFEDRLRLWAGRDFNGRNPFDEVFAGATIGAAGPDGALAIDSGPFSAYVVRDGRVVERRYRNGGVQRFTWTRAGESWLVTRSQQGSEELVVKFARVGEEFAPVELEFAGVFGRSWGPERFVLSKLSIR